MNGLIEDERISATGLSPMMPPTSAPRNIPAVVIAENVAVVELSVQPKRFQLREDQATNGITPADKQAKRDDGKH
ncbi:Uncharacterised protein [Escherichia coli]|uniref:Uncharacterized protein n=1 Tax=Escherichia coli TaxID=562 RepID=A0A376RHH9_ECOLX|nr:Uncharacterised protein [Escherichia coli]